MKNQGTDYQDNRKWVSERQENSRYFKCNILKADEILYLYSKRGKCRWSYNICVFLKRNSQHNICDNAGIKGAKIAT